MVPRPALIIAVLFLASAALFLTVSGSDSSDAAVLNGECGKDGDNLLWSYDEDTRVLTITGSGEMCDFYPEDRPWGACTSVSLPDGVTSIGKFMFYHCESLTSIEIPSSVTSIGDHAFYCCTSLTSIEIPSSVTSIDGGAFRHCESLTSIEIPSSVTSIEEIVFQGCYALSSVTIPSSVTSIGSQAFWMCSSLASITILPSVVSIEYDAFYGCDGLTTVIVPCTNPLGLVPGSDSYGGIAKHVSELTLIHDYSAAYAWADDGSSCTVTISCVHGDTDPHTENPEVSSSVKIPPTETEMGTTEYCVSGTVEGYDYYSSKDVKDIPVVVPGEDPEDDSIVLYAVIAVVAAIALAGAAFFLLRRPKSE